MNKTPLVEMARRMRLAALDMALAAGSEGAHLGPAFSCMEILAALYGRVLRHDPADPSWPGRDRFLCGKGHCVLALYPALAEAGYIPKEDLASFKKNGSYLSGHCARDLRHGFEYAGGSLGQALGVGLGLALSSAGAERRVFVLLGDGELNEGSNWEAFLAAAHFKAGRLVAVIDQNALQYDGPTEEVMALGDLPAKLASFGWGVAEVDGHDFSQLLPALEAPSAERPTAVVAHTVKGRGVSFMEGERRWHHAALSQAQYEQAKAEVAGGICGI